ncbi:hypothetical protein ACFFOM_06230 [Microlunatus capsulatus]|uniref:Heme/copper-type cytochrome/quinol oxidase subunit 2 n=1 Tax=Microlunatus capsulatus TaxID=99117 RepID=A0ABS4Z5J6_9ACTN|nr:hypothetical protein [Microlunatus capsulatus]MBP2416313.1 heme/copper-type cytochrome/quinol oxidase subunit 2 [Microlunatus capsulatus]
MSSAVNPSTGDRRPGPTGGASNHQELVARQKEQFGGMKFGCSFFGWLTATGTAVLLTALLAAIGAALGYKGVLGTQPADSEIRTIGLVSGIILLVVVLVAYFAGGYVAARMARFSGVKQGLGVWLWAVIFTIVVGVLGFVAGNQVDLMSRANGLPRLPVNSDALAGGGIITVAAIVLISLVGALLGGLAGMRYHRRVDRAGFDEA